MYFCIGLLNSSSISIIFTVLSKSDIYRQTVRRSNYQFQWLISKIFFQSRLIWSTWRKFTSFLSYRCYNCYFLNSLIRMIFTFNIHVNIQSSTFRHFKNKSHFGATLDSVIETLFIMCINLKIVKNSLKIQLWRHLENYWFDSILTVIKYELQVWIKANITKRLLERVKL